MNLCTSVFVYVGSIGLYKRIVNAVTQSIRIANADGQGATFFLSVSTYRISRYFTALLTRKNQRW